MKPGDRVRVVFAADAESALLLEKFIGKEGVIIRRDTDLEWGIGESEADPCYLVAVHGVGRERFFGEELALVAGAA